MALHGPLIVQAFDADSDARRVRLSMIPVGAAAALESKTTCSSFGPPLPVDLISLKKKAFRLPGKTVQLTCKFRIINHPLDPGLVSGTRYWLLCLRIRSLNCHFSRALTEQ